MIDKQKNAKKAELVKEIANKYGLTDISTEMDRFVLENEAYKAHILMVGGFSAGKSALLNQYIGRQVLRENQGPETDIAAELYFSEQERIVANRLDGTKVEIVDVAQVDVDQVLNLEYYLNSENLKALPDYILVDTPGFDSGVEKHNKALMQYIDHGTVFFLVVDCEKGTISKSALDFIDEVSGYGSNVAVIINKCDKRISEEIEEVKAQINDQIQAETGREIPIICTSIYDENVAAKIKKLVETFDPQWLYDQNVTSMLDQKRESLISALELIKKKETCDVSEIEEEIAKREKAKKKLLMQIEQMKKKMRSKLHYEVKERILSQISSQLSSSAESLAVAYQGGVNAFQERVMGIVRPIMISELEEYSSTIGNDFLNYVDFSSLNITDDSQEFQEIFETVYDKLKDWSNSGSNILIPLPESNPESILGKGAVSFANLDKWSIPALAFLGGTVSLPLRILIAGLPTILNVLGSLLGGGSREQKIVDAIRNQVIPQIISRIRTEIDKPLSEVETVMVENLTAQMNEVLDIENKALEIAMNKKKEAEHDYQEYVKVIDQDMETIRK